MAFGSDGAVVVTSTYEGSGWVPMRRYDPATGATSVLASMVRLDTMLAPSADRSVIGFAESDASDGPFGRYRVGDGDLLRKSGYTDGTSKYNYEMGANRNGTQYAIPTYGGTYIHTDDLHKITTIGQYGGPQPIGVVYHPAEDIVYFAWTSSTQVRAFDTNTFTQVAAYDFEHSFTYTGGWAFAQGRLKISGDGSLLMATVNGGALSYSVASNPAHGRLEGVAPYLFYTPDRDYNGTDSFTFKTTYGAASAEATVSITVAPVNDAPVADGQAITTTEDFGPTFVMTGSDVDGDSLTYQIVSRPSHGQIVAVSFYGPVYMPDPDFHGEDSFTFKANDGVLDSYPATINVTVTPVNDAPVAVGDTATTYRATPVSVPVRANDTDVDGDVLTVVAVLQGSAGGTVTINSGGTGVTLTPRNSFLGQETFSYTISDGKGGTSTATVLVNVVKK